MTDLSPAAVPDTNTVVSSFLFTSSTPAEALAQLQQRYRTLLSTEIRMEMEEVLRRTKFDHYLPVEKRMRLFLAFVDSCETLEPHIQIKACRHPKDDKFLSLAVSGNASLILSGDNDLLVLHPFRGIDILSPAKYLATHPR